MTSALHVLFDHCRAVARLVLDVAFPPSCPSCHAPVATHHQFCSACYQELRMIADPLCACCGIPFVVAIGAGAQCPECLESPPAFTRARAAMVYDGISAPLVSALKFHDQWAGLNHYVAVMQGAGSALLAEADVLIPVPLHWRRLWWRKYNQSALLAHALAVRTQRTCLPEALVRTRYTKPQMRLARKERKKNVNGVFLVHPAMRDALRDTHVLLIDDVVTTGATANACAEALLSVGVRQVDVLALARTVKE